MSAQVFYYVFQQGSLQGSLRDEAKELQNLKITPPSLNQLRSLIQKNIDKKHSPPNAFLIYRLVYLEALKRHNINWTMPKVSKMASKRWKKEDKKIKEEFHALWIQAENMCCPWKPRTRTTWKFRTGTAWKFRQYVPANGIRHRRSSERVLTGVKSANFDIQPASGNNFCDLEEPIERTNEILKITNLIHHH